MSTIMDEQPGDDGFAGSRRQGPWLLASVQLSLDGALCLLVL